MKNKFDDMFFDLNYAVLYLEYFEHEIIKYDKRYSYVLMICSILSALSVWFSYYMPYISILNYLTGVGSGLTVALLIVISKLDYKKQIFAFNYFNKEASELIKDIRMTRRHIDNLTENSIKNSIENFIERFNKINDLYISDLKLPLDGRLVKKCVKKASERNKDSYEKEYL